ncbi:hypothetical protein QBC37DRAFT_409208 [Rhypophila decipiens]|uniref:Uncharacterized protein n=1 Tax=Rhypophila decipiens TaxID=261697 RepID=A0AAN7BBB5_9PEZI|nr:hypothetical protein QBC37DRAFT_409208 [Rhypophila decipiens]
MVDIIGFASGVLTIYAFLEGLFPGQPDGPSATVRVAVGLSGSEGPDGGPDGPLTSPEGSFKSIRIYNNNGEFLSASPDNVGVDDGSYSDVTLAQQNTQQAPYVQIRVGDGEIVCLAYVSVTFSDGQKRAWDGTWAQPLGLDWYYSGILVSENDQNTGECIWMDEFVGTIFIYMPAFTGAGEDPNPDISAYTGERGFRAYTFNDAVGEIALPTGQRKKRAVKQADTRLVITDRPDHSAVRLCESSNSRGPSLVSLAEGMFCNMATRELLPLCVGDLTEDCFDVSTGNSGQRVASASAKETGFSSVIDWTSNAKF